MKRILVADVAAMDARYSAAFADWEVAFVRTMAEARQALARGDYDALAIGVYFDDSQAFDLVRALRTGERHATIPIVCVRGRPGFTAVTSRTLALTLKALGADEFIDLVDFSGDEAANAALRAAVERLLRS